MRGFHEYSPDGELLRTIEMPSDESDSPGYVISTDQGFLRNFTTRTVSTKGELLGTLEFPVDCRPLFMTTDYVWVRQSNEDGEDVAVRYRIEGLGSR